MKSDDQPMWDDPAEPAYVRDLLDAGRNAPMEYNVALGLATHLEHVKVGTALPHWAQAAGTTGMSTGALIAWIAVPVVAASVVAGIYFGARESQQPSAASGRTTESSALAQPGVVAPSPIASAVADQETPSQAQPLEAPSAQLKADSFRKPMRVARKSNERAADIGAKSLPRVVATGSEPSRTAARTAGAPQLAARSVLHHDISPAASKTIENRIEAEQRPAPAEQAVQPPAPQRPEVDESRLEREMQMLAVAQRVLTQDPERALRMAQQGEREFPKTMFSAERQQVAFLAMVKLGRIDEARRVGQPFLAKYPNAPWSARLRRALATGRIE